MRIFLIAADVAMGLILGIFLFAAASHTWPVLERWWVAAAVVCAAILVVLYRRPGGSLVRRGSRP